MSMPILATKLYVPPPRPKRVHRPRLTERLNEGLLRKLTLVSAPAGFGKTALVSEWLASCEQRTAWLSLDEGDNDVNRFLSYLVAALQLIAANAGEATLALLQSAHPPSMETMLTILINEIASIPDNFVLVLDDYHVLDAKPVDEALTFLLDHLPSQMHLVITTREDPQLPLTRLRVRNQLTELRATDLRFTPAEAAEFLGHVMDLNLSADDVAALERRTEGWIAGLQLAALSMRGNQDVSGFIQAFAGDHRYIVDYLVEEVLDRQSEGVRSFLLQTAVLDRLSGSLCAAVTNQPEGTERLEALERGNFFLVPLDDQRRWYRYHHLFADVLLAHLQAEQPDQVATLHRRASAWYEQNDLPADAIRHALAARDFERAATLIEQAVPAISRSRQESALLGWFQALPEELFQSRPVLSAYYAGTLLQSGQLDGVEARLQDAQRWLNSTADGHERPTAPPTDMIVVDAEAFRQLPGWIAISRAGIAMALGDVERTMNYARRALDLAAGDDHLRRGAAASFLGLALWAKGDLETAYRSFADGMVQLQQAGNISDVVGGALALADIRIAQGRLRDAMQVYQRGLQLASEQGTPALRGTADMYVGMSELYREYNDLQTAMQQLMKSRAQGEHTGFPQNPHRWRIAMARIRETEGDLDGALALLQEAERLYVSDFYPNVRPIAALKARVWIAQGRLHEALQWAREHNLSVEDDLSYLREFEHITLARMLLAQHNSDHADHSGDAVIGLLERLLQAAEAGARARSIIEISVLQALAHQMRDDVPAALIRLERALKLAEPEGYVRIFVDEGSAMKLLLERAAQRGIAPNYVRQLLPAFGAVQDRPPLNRTLSDPLSERELEVLRLLATDLSGPELADELTISLNTLRTHTKNIYDKLGVNNRRAAVRRAEELDFLSP